MWRNLKVLTRKGIVIGEKSGRRVFYRPNANREVLEYVISILHEGGLRKLQHKYEKYWRKSRRLYEQAIKTAEKAQEYERKLLKLAAMGMDPYAWNLNLQKNFDV